MDVLSNLYGILYIIFNFYEVLGRDVVEATGSERRFPLPSDVIIVRQVHFGNIYGTQNIPSTKLPDFLDLITTLLSI